MTNESKEISTAVRTVEEYRENPGRSGKGNLGTSRKWF